MTTTTAALSHRRRGLAATASSRRPRRCRAHRRGDVRVGRAPSGRHGHAGQTCDGRAGVSGDGLSRPGSVCPATAAGLPAAGSIAQIDHSIAAWTRNLAANPHDFVSATNLAVLYHGRGRLSADLGDQQKALDAARTAIAIIPDDPGPKALEATIDYTLHDFTGAFAITDAIVRADATQIGALATRLDAEIELGRIADARKDLATLSAATSGPAIDVRAARLAYVTGDARAGVVPVAAARCRRPPRTTRPTLASMTTRWVSTPASRVTLRRHAAPTPTRSPSAIPTSGRWSDLRGSMHSRDAPRAAIAGLEKAAAIAPPARDAGTAGRPRDGRRGHGGRGDRVQDRPLRRGSGTDREHRLRSRPDALRARPRRRDRRSLGQARASLAARPDYTGHDTVAWALYRLGRFDDAAAEIKAAGADGAADARVLFHAGAIALAAGDTSAGRKDLERALALGPALDPIERLEASRLLRN